MNMPIYRAKKVDSDEWVEGNYIMTEEGYYIYSCGNNETLIEVHKREPNYDDGAIDGEISILCNSYEIDPTTLAIHFEDMLDNTKVRLFASLQKDGRGGDIVEKLNRHNHLQYGVLKVHQGSVHFQDLCDGESELMCIQHQGNAYLYVDFYRSVSKIEISK